MIPVYVLNIPIFSSETNKYTPCGKYGLALIGNDSSKIYELILYKDKQNILTRAKISSTFTATIKENRFFTFYDDSNQNWLTHFDNATDSNEFTQQLEKRDIKIIDNSKNEKVDEKGDMRETELAIEEKDSSETQIKADILSRMAKMGQPILPVPVLKSTSDISDSESDTNRIAKKPIRKPRRNIPSTENASKPPETESKLEPVPQRPAVTSYHNFPGPLIPMQNTPQYPNYSGQVAVPQPIISPSYDPVNTFLSETRIQNTEIRMTLSELSNKLDSVLGKVRKEDVKSNEEKVLQKKIRALELQMLNLTKDLQVSLKTNEELEEKLANRDATLENEKQNRIKSLETKLAEAELRISQLQAQNLDDERFIKDLTTVAEKQDYNLAEFVSLCISKPTQKPLIHLVSNLKQKLQESERARKTAVAKSEPAVNYDFNAFSEKIQAVMNDLYQHIVNSYDTGNGTFSSEFVSRTLPRNVKTATNFILKAVQEDLKINAPPKRAQNMNESESGLAEFSD